MKLYVHFFSFDIFHWYFISTIQELIEKSEEQYYRVSIEPELYFYEITKYCIFEC